MKKIKVGDVLFQDAGMSIGRHVVYKVGRLYFYTNQESAWRGIKFDIETLRYKDEFYSSRDIQLYRTEQEIKDKNEHSELFKKARTFFSGHGKINISLEQLRTISDLINHPTTQ